MLGAACGGDEAPGGATGAGGAASAASTAVASGATGTGGEGETSQGGGGSAGAGGGGGQGGDVVATAATTSASTGGDPVCEPGSTIACYSGSPETLGVGECVGGAQTCNAAGTAYGACLGQVLPKAENCATVGDEDCDGEAPLCTGDPLWIQGFGDASTAEALAVGALASGGAVVAGRFHGALSFGPIALQASPAGTGDAFVAAFDEGGAPLWAVGFGGDGAVSIEAVAVDPSGRVFVAGTLRGAATFGGLPLASAGGDDALLAKVDATGDVLWAARFGDAADQRATALATDPAGNVFVAGDVEGAIDLGGGALTSAGARDVFVAKWTGDGLPLWSQIFGDATDQRLEAMAEDTSGGVVIAGAFAGSIDLGGVALASQGGADAFVAKINAGGLATFAVPLGGDGDQVALAVATDDLGNVLVTGRAEGVVDLGAGPLLVAGPADAFVAKLNTAGGALWGALVGGPGADAGRALDVDGARNVVVAGTFEASLAQGVDALVSAGDADALLFKLTASGEPLWAKGGGGPHADALNAVVCVEPSGEIVAAGAFEGPATFDGAALPGAGGLDVLVWRALP
jgi:hypothetical protein